MPVYKCHQGRSAEGCAPNPLKTVVAGWRMAPLATKSSAASDNPRSLMGGLPRGVPNCVIFKETL